MMLKELLLLYHSRKKPIKADKKPIKADKERVKSILEYINQNENITNKEARELLNLADSTTKRLLAQMVLDGLIEAIGENKKMLCNYLLL